MLKKRHIGLLLLGFLLAMLAAGCKKKVPPPPPPPAPVAKREEAPPPASKAPTITSFSAEPSSIERGQSATLSWSVSDASDITIDQGIGAVQSTGTRRVFPSDTTTYTLTARGGGQSVTRQAVVNVTAPAPPPPAAPAVTEDFGTRLSKEVQDAYFDYDHSDVREDARGTLTKDADALKAILQAFPSSTIVVEGHCDERGSAEYNLGLGDRRASAARDFLVQLGVPADKLRTISYGKERPQCSEGNEDCWQRNRRAHFAPGQ